MKCEVVVHFRKHTSQIGVQLQISKTASTIRQTGKTKGLNGKIEHSTRMDLNQYESTENHIGLFRVWKINVSTSPW